MTPAEQMIGFLSCALSGQTPDKAACTLTEEEGERLFRLSSAHDMAHLVGEVLLQNGLLPDGSCRAAFENQGILAVYRFEKMRRQCENISAAFRKGEIEHIFLKGAVIRRYYPEMWMRTSCDIDVLVKEESVRHAADLLKEKYGYTEKGGCFHDVSLYSPDGVHLELHFSLLEDAPKMDAVLARAWSYAHEEEPGTYSFAFTPAFFLFHQVAHAAHHFLRGGCGVRPVADLFLLQNKMPYDASDFSALTAEAGLSRFAEEMFALGRMWFAAGERDAVLSAMEDFLLSGGVYGSTENQSAVGQAEKKGKAGFVLSRLFLPYEQMQRRYPRLRGRKFLLPFYEVKRWCELLFNPMTRRRGTAEWRATVGTTREKGEKTVALLTALELGEGGKGE